MAPLVSQSIHIGTVSYTHLRAHETVLDLVCRLLLEKKKTYITISRVPMLANYRNKQLKT